MRLTGKKVVVVLNWAMVGGAERAALDVAAHLAETEGAEVEICALTHENGRVREMAEELGFPWTPVRVSWDRSRLEKGQTLARLATALRRMRPDVVLSHCAVPNVLCGLVWRTTGASLCVWNQHDLHVPRRFRESTLRRAAGRVPLVVAVSDGARAFLTERLAVDPVRVHVVRNSAVLPSPGESRESWRARLGLGADSLATVMLANFNDHKDHATLLTAWSLVLERMPPDRPPTLFLAGPTGRTEDAVKALAFDLDLRSSVRFLGDVEDVSGLLRAMDLGVLSSHGEAFSRSVQEYMAAGLPVVGSDVGGIREVVGPEGTPFLAPAGDSEELADRLLVLLRDDSLRAQLGTAHAQRARVEWSVERTTVAYADLLVETLGVRHGLSRRLRPLASTR